MRTLRATYPSKEQMHAQTTDSDPLSAMELLMQQSLPALSHEEQLHLSAKIRDPDIPVEEKREIADRVVRSVLQLIARRTRSVLPYRAALKAHDISYADLVSSVLLRTAAWLMEGKWNARESRLSTILWHNVYWWARREIEDTHGVGVRLPVYTQSDCEANSEAAKALVALLRDGKNMQLDAPLGEDGESTAGSVLCATTDYDPERAAEVSSEMRALERLMEERLTDRERRILLGFHRGERTLKELADELGFSRERARQILNKAIAKLRAPSAEAAKGLTTVRALASSRDAAAAEREENHTRIQTLLGRGHNQNSIAAALGVSKHTVGNVARELGA